MTVDHFFRSMQYNEETMKEALKLQKDMSSNMGGTEILPALKHIYGQKTRKGYKREVWLVFSL